MPTKLVGQLTHLDDGKALPSLPYTYKVLSLVASLPKGTRSHYNKLLRERH